MNENSFSHEKLCTRLRAFWKEAFVLICSQGSLHGICCREMRGKIRDHGCGKDEKGVRLRKLGTRKSSVSHYWYLLKWE